MKSSVNTIVIGGGCFWCTEAIYLKVKGVISVEPGYSGGSLQNPTYQDICTGTTGHAEVIKIEYDTEVISLQELLRIFFFTHNPTTLNRQGADVGTQYRSVVFYNNETEKLITQNLIKEIDNEHIYDDKIVTTLEPFTQFYIAEDYHKNYYQRNQNQGYCRMVITPKVDKFEKLFIDYVK